MRKLSIYPVVHMRGSGVTALAGRHPSCINASVFPCLGTCVRYVSSVDLLYNISAEVVVVVQYGGRESDVFIPVFVPAEMRRFCKYVLKLSSSKGC